MFGMGFMEIFLVLIVAIIALGPEKLPGALVEVAKFFKKIKGEIHDAKSTIDRELDLSQMKQDTQELKDSISNIQNMANIDLDDLGKQNAAPTMEELTKERKLEDTKENIDSKKTSKTSKRKEKISMKKDKQA